METETNVTINVGSASTLILYTDGNAGQKIKIDGEDFTVAVDGTVTVQINGSCTITKKNSINLFVIVLAAPEAWYQAVRAEVKFTVCLQNFRPHK